MGALRGIQAFSVRLWRDRQKLVRKELAFQAKLLPLDGPKATCIYRKVWEPLLKLRIRAETTTHTWSVFILPSDSKADRKTPNFVLFPVISHGWEMIFPYCTACIVSIDIYVDKFLVNCSRWGSYSMAILPWILQGVRLSHDSHGRHYI